MNASGQPRAGMPIDIRLTPKPSAPCWKNARWKALRRIYARIFRGTACTSGSVWPVATPGDQLPERTDPLISPTLAKLTPDFFDKLQARVHIHLTEHLRLDVIDAVYGWLVLHRLLQRMGCAGLPRGRKRGQQKKWDQDVLLALLCAVFKDAGGKRGLSWTSDGSIDSPEATFLGAIWGLLPTHLKTRTSTETFVRRARTNRSFGRRDDMAHSQWQAREEQKRRAKAAAARERYEKKRRSVTPPA